jgi:hypothetical protein
LTEEKDDAKCAQRGIKPQAIVKTLVATFKQEEQNNIAEQLIKLINNTIRHIKITQINNHNN